MRQIYFKKNRPNPYFGERLPQSLRSQKKKRQLKLIFIFSAVNLILIFYLLFFSNYFLISQIEVRGLADIPKDFIIQLIKNQMQKRSFLIGRQTNLILFKQKRVVEKINQSVALEKIIIKKNLPDKIIVEIQEKKPVLTWVTDNKFYYLDKNGIVIREVNFFSVNPYLPLVYNKKNDLPKINQPAIEAAKINFIFDLLGKLPSEIKISSLEASGSKMEFLILETKEGWQIIFDPSQSLENQLNNLNLIIKNKSQEEIKKMNYLDLRFPDRIYYKE